MNQPTKNHLEILEEIIRLLKNNGFEAEQILLENEISASSTGGEICLRCGSLLLTLNKQKKIKKVIGELTFELIDYCHYNGLDPVAIKIK
ncbi:hypothetical protein SAMN05428642_1271 [Flaviramulus basaltis]|uniref:Uncharacterized protein n=1 Tax=Flaviramulus basaltis TaxID=369401 RepID=A0A1K2ISG1_9FLAO|nr:hypothetical protein [Flaviramulus basaltis]SFZ95311.1 hypothetical protein SAMN05428642_1271 [Flaviramulus basaltis]